MENPQTQNEVPAPKKKDNSTLIIGGVVALLVIAASVVVVLVVNQSQASPQQAAANFPQLGGNAQNLNGQFGNVGEPNDGQGNGQFNGQFGGPNGGLNFQMTPAKELPTAQADLNGFVTQVNGQSLMVGQRFGRGLRPDATPDAAQAASTPLPDVEVIVASDTVIYQDTTPRPDFQNGQPPSEPVAIQQQVTLSSLSALPANSRVTVWGARSGNQITAKVIVFSQAFQRPQSPNGGTPGG